MNRRDYVKKLLFESEYSSELQKKYGTAEYSVDALEDYLLLQEVKLSREMKKLREERQAKEYEERRAKEFEEYLKNIAAADKWTEYYKMLTSANSK